MYIIVNCIRHYGFLCILPGYCEIGQTQVAEKTPNQNNGVVAYSASKGETTIVDVMEGEEAKTVEEAAAKVDRITNVMAETYTNSAYHTEYVV